MIPDCDLAVSYLEIVPDELVDTLVSQLSHAGLVVVKERRENSVFAGVEWLLPSAIVIFIGEKYFGTMIQEAAKEHYPSVKAAFLALLRRTVGEGRQVRITRIASRQTPHKLSSEQPAAVSIYAILRSGHHVKFAFDDTMNEDVHMAALEDMLLVLERYYAGDSGGPIESASRNVQRRGLPIVMRYDRVSSSWKPWSPSPTGSA